MTEREESAVHTLATIAAQHDGVITTADYQAAYDTGRTPTQRWYSEAQLQSCVLELARLWGWAPYHTRDSRGSVAGFPDLELSRSHPFPRMIKAELKSERGKPTSEQVDWLNLYAAMGEPIEVYLWRPQHIDDIAEILKPDWKCHRADPGMFGLWSLGSQSLEVRAVPTQARQKARGAPRNANGTRL